MTSESRWKNIPVGVAIGGVLAGLIGGYFAAHMMMGDMREGEKRTMKEMDMKDMPGMKEVAPSSPGAVAIPAVMRQVIGVRSTPVVVVPLTPGHSTTSTVNRLQGATPDAP